MNILVISASFIVGEYLVIMQIFFPYVQQLIIHANILSIIFVFVRAEFVVTKI